MANPIVNPWAMLSNTLTNLRTEVGLSRNYVIQGADPVSWYGHVAQGIWAPATISNEGGWVTVTDHTLHQLQSITRTLWHTPPAQWSPKERRLYIVDQYQWNHVLQPRVAHDMTISAQALSLMCQYEHKTKPPYNVLYHGACRDAEAARDAKSLATPAMFPPILPTTSPLTIPLMLLGAIGLSASIAFWRFSQSLRSASQSTDATIAQFWRNLSSFGWGDLSGFVSTVWHHLRANPSSDETDLQILEDTGQDFVKGKVESALTQTILPSVPLSDPQAPIANLPVTYGEVSTAVDVATGMMDPVPGTVVDTGAHDELSAMSIIQTAGNIVGEAPQAQQNLPEIEEQAQSITETVGSILQNPIIRGIQRITQWWASR